MGIHLQDNDIESVLIASSIVPVLPLMKINPLTPELNPSAQRCLLRFFTGDFNF
jgi:hypothetical protein